jgi:hypothetical protein
VVRSSSGHLDPIGNKLRTAQTHHWQLSIRTLKCCATHDAVRCRHEKFKTALFDMSPARLNARAPGAPGLLGELATIQLGEVCLQSTTTF